MLKQPLLNDPRINHFSDQVIKCEPVLEKATKKIINDLIKVNEQ